jgi:hypothetical protein
VFKWNKWTSWHSGFCRFPHGFPGILDSSLLSSCLEPAMASLRRLRSVECVSNWSRCMRSREDPWCLFQWERSNGYEMSWHFHTRSVVFCEPCEQCQEVLFGWSQAMSALLGIPDCGEPHIKGNWGFFDFR